MLLKNIIKVIIIILGWIGIWLLTPHLINMLDRWLLTHTNLLQRLTPFNQAFSRINFYSYYFLNGLMPIIVVCLILFGPYIFTIGLLKVILNFVLLLVFLVYLVHVLAKIVVDGVNMLKVTPKVAKE